VKTLIGRFKINLGSVHIKKGCCVLNEGDHSVINQLEIPTHYNSFYSENPYINLLSIKGPWTRWDAIGERGSIVLLYIEAPDVEEGVSSIMWCGPNSCLIHVIWSSLYLLSSLCNAWVTCSFRKSNSDALTKVSSFLRYSAISAMNPTFFYSQFYFVDFWRHKGFLRLRFISLNFK